MLHFCITHSQWTLCEGVTQKLHKSALSPRKRAPAWKCRTGFDVMRWFSQVSLGGWAGGTGATIIRPETLWECVRSLELPPNRQKKNIAVIPALSPRFRWITRCGCVFQFKTRALTPKHCTSCFDALHRYQLRRPVWKPATFKRSSFVSWLLIGRLNTWNVEDVFKGPLSHAYKIVSSHVLPAGCHI